MLGVIEAVLYAAGEDGIELGRLSQILGISSAATRQQLEAYAQKLDDSPERGLKLRSSDERYYLLTKPEYAAALKKYFQGPPASSLSQAALEVLAIIAYKQPVTRVDIDELRGVHSSGALQTLVTHQLIEEAGRLDAPGRPIMYATSTRFLDYFGLARIEDLPQLPDEQDVGSDENLDLFARGTSNADGAANVEDKN